MMRPTRVIGTLDTARGRTVALVEGLDDAFLEHAWSPMMSPLAWDLGHIATYVTWFEADAFARSQGARLPPEAEWERAATSEYSAPFFDAGFRVLRGGSWATHPHLRAPTNRNWDLPQRRQIFSSVRLAQDA